MNTLFDMSKIPDKEKNKNKCKDCKYIERWQCNSKHFFYCSIKKSNITNNGLLKVKCKNEACSLFKLNVKMDDNFIDLFH